MQTPHILIVDNDPMAALVTQHGLQRLLEQGVQIETAASASVARARCLDKCVDLLIIDPSTENSAETALLKEIQRMQSDIEVLVLTAYDTPRLRSQMRSLGVKHYLAKPVELRDLGETVRYVMHASAGAAPNV